MSDFWFNVLMILLVIVLPALGAIAGGYASWHIDNMPKEHLEPRDAKRLRMAGAGIFMAFVTNAIIALVFTLAIVNAWHEGRFPVAIDTATVETLPEGDTQKGTPQID